MQDKNEPAPPHYVVIVTEPYLIENEALLRYMNDADNQVGITTLFAYGNITRIPKSCNAIIQSDDTRTGYYIKNKNANRFTPFALDKIEPERICAFANELSRLPIKRDSRSLGIADRISFLQMYKAGNIQELDIEYAAKRVEEKLSVESDFGYGKDIVINCENNIAKQLQFLLDIIPVADNGNIEENMKAINTAISNINSLLRKRTELKRR